MGVAEAFSLSIDPTVIETKRVVDRKKRKGERDTEMCIYIQRDIGKREGERREIEER